MIRIVYPDELMHSSYIAIDSSNSIWHYGRPGMKWYQHIYGNSLENSTARAKRRIAKRGAKIQRIKSKGIDASKAYNLKAKQSEYQDKLYKLEAKNSKTKVRLMKGKKIGLIGRHNLLQEQRIKSKKANIDAKLNKPESEIKKLEYNNRRDEERITKNDKRLRKLDNRVDKGLERRRVRADNAEMRAARAEIKARKEYGVGSEQWRKADNRFKKAVSKHDELLSLQAKNYRSSGVYQKSKKKRR